MALINCPECGKQNVSDSALSCPECGYAIKEHFERIRLEQQHIAEEAALKEKRETDERLKKETEGQRQQETIARLEKQIEDSSKEIKKAGIGLVISIPLTILFWCLSYHGSLGILIVICSIAVFVSGVFLASGIIQKNTAVKDLEAANRSIDEYENTVEKRMQVYAAQARASQAKNAAKHPKCPMCGSTNTERIGTINRAASAAAVGLASSKIGKQYQCKNCKHKW